MELIPRHFYQHHAVQQRIAEYCGGNAVDPESFSAEYLSGINEHSKPDPAGEEHFISAGRGDFPQLLDQGMDIFRAAWDRTSTLGVLDVEYFNLVYPGEAYYNPERSFKFIEPVYRRILRCLGRFGITPVCIMTGQGYHFTFRVDFSSEAHRQLVDLGRLEHSLTTKYCAPAGSRSRPVPLTAGLAFSGMGRVMEYVAHLVLRELGPGYTGIPVVCTDVSVGRSREAVALDLSMYADPLYTRDIRCPFSTYQKHKVMRDKYGHHTAREIPVMVTLPRPRGMALSKLLRARRDEKRSLRLAAAADVRIPDASEGFARLLAAYRASKLFRFHRRFDETDHDHRDVWPLTYDRLDTRALPPCVAHCLHHPNDHVLKPTNLQSLTRVLMKNGWHPKHIAGLVRSKLERDHGWGRQWRRYDPAMRANFYIRLFAGLLACGIDREEDLNCFSHAEKGYCSKPGCGYNLADYRAR